MLAFAGFRFILEEVSVDLGAILCAKRYVICRVDMYRSEVSGRQKEVKVPIAIETDEQVAEGLVKMMNNV